MTAQVTRVGSTSQGWLHVEVDFGDGHLNDFLFPDLTSEHDVEAIVTYTILNWREHHPEFTGDHRSEQLIISDADPKGAVALVKHLEGMAL